MTRGGYKGTRDRQHYNADGSPKIPHANAGLAFAQARSVWETHGEHLDVYQCGICRRWHAGHQQR